MDMPVICFEHSGDKRAACAPARVLFKDLCGRTVAIPLSRLLERRTGPHEDLFLSYVLTSLLVQLCSDNVLFFEHRQYPAYKLEFMLDYELEACPYGQVILFCKRRIRESLRDISLRIQRDCTHEVAILWFENSWIYSFENSDPNPEFDEAKASVLHMELIEPHSRTCFSEDCSSKIDESTGHLRTFRDSRTQSHPNQQRITSFSYGDRHFSKVSEPNSQLSRISESSGKPPLLQDHRYTSFAVPGKSSGSTCDLRFIDSGLRSVYDPVSHKCVTRQPNQNDDGTLKEQSSAVQETSTTTLQSQIDEEHDLTGNTV
jgi:hypothetical protein